MIIFISIINIACFFGLCNKKMRVFEKILTNGENIEESGTLYILYSSMRGMTILIYLSSLGLHGVKNEWSSLEVRGVKNEWSSLEVRYASLRQGILSLRSAYYVIRK